MGYSSLPAHFIGAMAISVAGVAIFSMIMYVIVLLAIVVNLSVLDRSGDLWARIQPFHGIAQRSPFAAWFPWREGYAVPLMGAHRRLSSHD